MKLFKTLFIIWSFSVGAALPPTTIKGQNGSSSGFFNLQVPGNSVTKLNSTTALIETGNGNLLVNGSFEHPTAGSGWTNGATIAVETGTKVHGTQSAKITTSTFNEQNYQDSTINAADVGGLQGVARAYVKNPNGKLSQVCARVNGSGFGTSNCVSIATRADWQLVEIPFILGSTSNGITFVGGSGAGDYYVDNVFVGLGTLDSVSQVVGEWTSYTQTIKGATSDPTKGTVTVDNARYRVLGNSIEIYYVYVQTAAGSGAAGSGSYYFPLPNSYTLDTTALNASTDSEVATVLGSCEMNNTTNKALNSQALAYSSAGFGIRTSGSASYIGSATSYGLNAASIRWSCHLIAPVSELRGNVNFVSSANRDYDWTSYTPTFTGFGTVSSPECFHKRKGSDLFIQCRFNSGSTTAVEPRLSLPSGLTISSTYVPSITSKGVYFRNSAGAAAGSKGSAILAEPSVGYVTFSTADVFSGTNANWKTKVSSASAVFASGDEFSVQVGPLPISGWTDYGVIVGSFKDYVSSPGAGKLITVGADFYTTAAGTVCSSSPCTLGNHYGDSGWITSITRSATGDYSATLTPAYWSDVTKVRCSIRNPSVGWAVLGLPNGSGVFSITNRNNTGSYAAVDLAGTLECIGKKP